MRSSDPAGGAPPAAHALVALYAVSGLAALLLETTWLRWFRLLFGATAPAASAALVAFFAGQALGAALGARFVPRLRRPLSAYGALELGAGAGALAVPALLAAGEALVRPFYAELAAAPAALTALRFAIALAATLPAAACMGAALPAIGAARLPQRRDLGGPGTALYAANLAGAAAGAALAAFALPEWIGLSGSHGLGAALLAAVGAVAWLLGRRRRAREITPAPEPVAAAEPGAPRLGPRAIALLAALSGFGALAAQVLLVRAFSLVLDQSAWSFGAVAVTVLCALALGAGIVSLARRRSLASPEALLVTGLCLASLGLAVFPALLSDLTDGLTPLTAAAPGAPTPAAALRLAFASAGLALLGAALALPALFAAAGESGAGRAEAHLGRLAAANTAGAIAGALVAPFVWLETLSLWASFLALSIVYALPAIFVPLSGRRARLRRDLALALGWIAVLSRANPLALPDVAVRAGEQVEAWESSAAALVAVVRRGDERLLRIDGHYSLGGSADRVHQERQGHLAALLRPGARRVAWIGSATGISAGAITAHGVERLALVELVPGVAHAAADHFGAENRGVHTRPTTRVVIDDARNFLRATDERFDLIAADLFVPWRAGAGSLYAREHFENARSRLTADGAFVQWLPLYQLDAETFAIVAATFLDVFPRAAVFRGDFFGRFPIAALVGYPGSPPSPEAISSAAARLGAAGEGDRWIADPLGVWSLYAGPLGPLAPRLAGVERNSDAWPRVEQRAARNSAAAGGAPREPFVAERWLGFVEALRSAARRSGDDVFPGLSPAARRASRGGALLQAASTEWSAGHPDSAARLLAAAADSIPARLLDPDHPDPTAAEVWPE